MSFEMFREKIMGIAHKAGVLPIITQEDGQHIARFPDGTTIYGNAIAPSVKVCYGRGIHGGHAMHATL